MFRGTGMEFSGVQNYGYVELGITFARNLHPCDQVQILLLCGHNADSDNLTDYYKAFCDFIKVTIYEIEGTGFKTNDDSLKES